MSIEFIITSFVIIVLPGTGVIYTIACALGKGFKLSVMAAIGCTLGILPHVLASITGLAAILNASAHAFQFIKYLGVVYLLYMAWNIWKDKDILSVSESEAGSISIPKVILNGMLINILNPKLTIFFLAFLPQFVSTNSTMPIVSLTTLALVFMVMTFIVFVGYGYFASLTRDYVFKRPKVMDWLRKSFSGIFCLLATKLAFSER